MVVKNVPWAEHYREIGVRIPDESGLGDAMHHKIHQAAAKFRERAQAVAKLDPGLKDDIRLKRSAEMLRKARLELADSVSTTTQHLRKNLADLETRQVMAGQPKGPEDSKAGRDLWQRSVFDMRGQLERLPRKERGAAIRAACAAGNPLPLAAIESSLVPLVSEQLVTAARSQYAETADTEIGALIEAADDAVGEAALIERQLSGMARTVALDEGVEREALDAFVPAPPKLSGKALKKSRKEKTAFISEHGLPAFQEAVNAGQAPWADDDSDDSSDDDPIDDDKPEPGAIFVPSGDAAA